MGIRAGLVLGGVRKTYRARYYNPTTGRFLSEDPIGFEGSGTNLYAYASENPLSFTDPSGMCPKITCTQLQMAAGLAAIAIVLIMLVAAIMAAFMNPFAAEVLLEGVAEFLVLQTRIAAAIAGVGTVGKGLGLCQ
jgi:hypothetical protein